MPKNSRPVPIRVAREPLQALESDGSHHATAVSLAACDQRVDQADLVAACAGLDLDGRHALTFELAVDPRNKEEVASAR